MQTLFFIVVALSLIGLFVQNYTEVEANAEASPVNLNFSEWIKHTWLEIALNVGCYVALCLGIDIGLGEKAFVVAADGVTQTAFTIAITAGVAAATAIKKLVQFTLLPLFGFIFKSRTAKVVLRDKMVEARFKR